MKLARVTIHTEPSQKETYELQYKYLPTIAQITALGGDTNSSLSRLKTAKQARFWSVLLAYSLFFDLFTLFIDVLTGFQPSYIIGNKWHVAVSLLSFCGMVWFNKEYQLERDVLIARIHAVASTPNLLN